MKNDINLTNDGKNYIVTRLIKQRIRVAYAPIGNPLQLVKICNSKTEDFIALCNTTKPPRVLSLKFVAPKGYYLDPVTIETVRETILDSLNLEVSSGQVRAIAYKIGSDDPTFIVEEITSINKRRRNV